MKIESVIEFLPESFTKPFVAYTDLNEKVVVKAMVRPTMGKVLLNEYLAGNLAMAIGLPWPHTSLATLSSNAIQFLRDNSLEVHSADCVATLFVENLTPTNWPDPPQGFHDWNMQNHHLLPEANSVHMQSYFDHPEKQSPFYGRALFEIWLFFLDFKYDTLFVLPNKTPFFLDGSHALAGPDWELDEMKYHPYFTIKSPYLEGILTHPDLFDEWLDRIESIPESDMSSLLNIVPTSWRITTEQLNFLLDLLTKQRKDFIKSWKGEINQALLRGQTLVSKRAAAVPNT